MTAYPNREHENADRGAARRARTSLEVIASEAGNLRRSLDAGTRLDGRDAQHLADLVRELTLDLTVLGTLRDVREWHAADQAEAGSMP